MKQVLKYFPICLLVAFLAFAVSACTKQKTSDPPIPERPYVQPDPIKALKPDDPEYSTNKSGDYAKPKHFANIGALDPFNRDLLETNEADIKEIASFLQRVTTRGGDFYLDDNGQLINTKNTQLGAMEPVFIRLLQNSPYPLTIAFNEETKCIYFRMLIGGSATSTILYDALEDIGYSGNHSAIDIPLAQRWVARYFVGV
jgi:hypothetical protein